VSQSLLAGIDLIESPRLIGQTPGGFKVYLVGSSDQHGEMVALTKNDSLGRGEEPEDMRVTSRDLHERLMQGRRSIATDTRSRP
jgi:hypothetical protein